VRKYSVSPLSDFAVELLADLRPYPHDGRWRRTCRSTSGDADQSRQIPVQPVRKSSTQRGSEIRAYASLYRGSGEMALQQRYKHVTSGQASTENEGDDNTHRSG
jgi:hypothetical protein